MASFDISSEMDWQELSNAVQLTLKEVRNRFDFKGVESNIDLDQKASFLTLTCSQPEKLSSLNDVFQSKLIKRGLSLLSFDYQTEEAATGRSVRQKVIVHAGISKEKGKEIVKEIKNSKIKVQAQIQDDVVRVTSKSRDDLQSVMAYLKPLQEKLKIPMQFGNYR
ncbi:MAG: YajQ family cyclic di-GMP-binding protein [Bdellovibrionaceae bacterium]|nr:YajQ family cyclic di-GMP-binding protein [Pseudobdellovibrionaceae bacterium]